MVQENNHEEVLKEFNIKNGDVIRLIAVPGQRPYRDVQNDKIILIEIEEHTGNRARTAYPTGLLEAMWEAVFDVWEKPEKKASYATRFANLIRNKLQQSEMKLH